MEFLLSLPKTLLDVAVSLLKIKKDDRSRQRLADLLASVAKCVSGIADAVAEGKHPSRLCGELEVYIANLESLVCKETDTETAKQLTFWLRHVEAVPGVSRIDVAKTLESESTPKWTSVARYKQAESIRRVAGLVEGVANLVRV